MKTIHMMVLKSFLPVLVGTVVFFVLVWQLMDIFGNIVRYLTKDVSLEDIGIIALYYIPKCVIYSLPIGLLFSITFTLGNFYMNNELISIYGSGISLYRLIIPFFIVGILLCFFMFFFEEKVAIPSFKLKNQIYKRVLDMPEPYSNHNVAVKAADNKIVYQASFYNDKLKTLTGVTILERDEEGNLLSRIEAESAEWKDTNWVLKNCTVYSWDDTNDHFKEESLPEIDSEKFSEKPGVFQKLTRNIDEMEYTDAYDWIISLKKAGRPYQGALSEFYKKFSFALTPLIVILVSCSIGGLLKKNVLLLSLFLSICIIVVYYVTQMLAMTLANFGYIHPFWGAWSAFFLFAGLGIFFLKLART
ncbi:MAG: LptF/LptG family permease [Spirochaetales bacterium]|nr:LptF/LptG family permease [Spirochaetales bacterium]